MAHLDKLKFSNRVIAAARPRRTIDTLEYRRNKLIANLEEQVELANRALQDKPLTLRRKRGHRLIDVRPVSGGKSIKMETWEQKFDTTKLH